MKHLVLVALAATLVAAPAAAEHIQVTGTISTGDGPFGAALSADGSRLYVSEFGDVLGFGPNPGATLGVFDTETHARIATIPTGVNPEDIVLASDGFGYVVNSSSADVTVFSTETNEVVDTIPVGSYGLSFLFSIAEVPGQRKLYVSSAGGDLDGSDENIWVIDIDPDAQSYRQVTGTILLAGGITRFAFDPARDLAYAGLGFAGNDFDAQPKIVVIDAATDTVLDTIDVNVAGTGFHGVEDVAISPDGKTLWVPVFDFFGGTSEVFVIDLASRKIVNLVQVAEDFSQHGIGMSPDGALLLVTNFLSGTVSVVLTSTETVIEQVTVGAEPNEVIFSADGATAYVTDQASDTVSILSIGRTIDVIDGAVQDDIASGDADDASFVKSFDRRVGQIQDALDDGNEEAAAGKMGSLESYLGSSVDSGKVSIGEEIPGGDDPSASLNEIKAGGK